MASGITAFREGRRRTSLNEAMHELRRPLQVLALSLPADSHSTEAIGSALQMATAAIDQLDREINGGPAAVPAEPVSVRPMVAIAVARWRPRAAAEGRSLRLIWGVGELELRGDRAELGQALDNLISNALEHGLGDVTIDVREEGGLLRVGVRDRGTSERVAVARPVAAPGLRHAKAPRARAEDRAAGCRPPRRQLPIAPLRLRRRSAARPALGGGTGVSRRGRAAAFLIVSLLAAVAAAAIADGYGERVARGYGKLRPVLVAAGELRAGEEVDPAGRRRSSRCGGCRSGSRRPPPWPGRRKRWAWRPRSRSRRAPTCSQPSCGLPRSREAGARLGRGRRPVEIVVSGAGALSALGAQPVGSRVDVVVTTEPSGAGAAAPTSPRRRCRCWPSGPGPEGGSGEATATLGLTRSRRCG